MRMRQILDSPVISKRMRLNKETFERFFFHRSKIVRPCSSNSTLHTLLSAVMKGSSKNSRSRLIKFPRSLTTERIKRVGHAERGRDMRIEDPGQRRDREDIEGTGVSSSREGAGNEPHHAQLNRVPVLASREQSDDVEK